MTPHLTHQQLCDLLLDPPTQQNESPTSAAHISEAHVSQAHVSKAHVSKAQDHLRDCYACSAELATLTASLTGYRNIAHAVAQRDFAALPRTAPTPLLGQRSPLHPVYWAIAATALVIAILPFTAPRHAPLAQLQTSAVVTSATTSYESDAALLEDINQDLSTSIPPSMQPLADPTANSSSNIDSTTQRTN
jgi:hypothetical protein